MRRSPVPLIVIVLCALAAAPATRPKLPKRVLIHRTVATDDAPAWIKSHVSSLPERRIARMRQLYHEAEQAERDLATAQADAKRAAARPVKRRTISRDDRWGNVTTEDRADLAARSREVREAKNRAAEAGRRRAEALWALRDRQLRDGAIFGGVFQLHPGSVGTIASKRVRRILEDGRLLVEYSGTDLIVPNPNAEDVAVNQAIDFKDQLFRFVGIEPLVSTLGRREHAIAVEAVNPTRHLRETAHEVEATGLEDELRDLFGKEVIIPLRPGD